VAGNDGDKVSRFLVNKELAALGVVVELVLVVGIRFVSTWARLVAESSSVGFGGFSSVSDDELAMACRGTLRDLKFLL
jgi:hypothetical protein